MSEEEKVIETASDKPGSADDAKDSGPSKDGESQSKDTGKSEETISKQQYEEAQKLIGKQGQELGDLRNFFNDITPLLDKLQAQPEVIEAVLEGKLDSDMAKAVLEGKVKVEDAKVVTDAHAEVKKAMGGKTYEKASPEDIEKLVMEKVEQKIAEQTATFEKGIGEIENRREFEQGVGKFIESTNDFDEYADEVSKWLVEHPDQYDIRVAYEAVKGREVVAKAAAAAESNAAEEAKKIAANAGGGSGVTVTGVEAESVADKLVAGKSNPNVF